MRSRAVVLTYPGHFLLTKLTLKSIKVNLPEIQEITIIADDCSLLAWPGYIDDCIKSYQCHVIPVSSTGMAKVEPGWLRQQMIKMHIDQLIDWPEFFITDGDIIFDSAVPYDIVPFNYIDFTDIDLHQSRYVSRMLGIPHRPLKIGDQDAITSNSAFRDTKAKWWNSMRSYIENRFNQSLLDLHKDLESLQGVTEWELIESYKINVLKIDPKFGTLFCQEITNPQDQVLGPKFSTCWCVDRELGYEWWHTQGINLDLWEILPNSK